MFPEALKVSTLPHFEILGAPIGYFIYCASFVSTKRSEALKLLSKQEDMLQSKTPGLPSCFYACVAAFPSLSTWQELLQQYLSSRPFSSLTLILSVVSHHV